VGREARRFYANLDREERERAGGLEDVSENISVQYSRARANDMQQEAAAAARAEMMKQEEADAIEDDRYEFVQYSPEQIARAIEKERRHCGVEESDEVEWVEDVIWLEDPRLPQKDFADDTWPAEEEKERVSSYGPAAVVTESETESELESESEVDGCVFPESDEDEEDLEFVEKEMVECEMAWNEGETEKWVEAESEVGW
jgi:hypothetical protein